MQQINTGARSEFQAGKVLRPVAGVMAVGMAAWVSAGAEAAIIYDGGGNAPVNAPVTTTQSYDVKFDGASVDLNFGTSNFNSSGNYLKVSTQGAPANSSDLPDAQGKPAALTAGAPIGPEQTFGTSSAVLYDGTTTPPGGNFMPGTPAYVGAEFTGADNNLHYGWVQFEVIDGSASAPVGNVIDYAYESTPGAAIAAGAVPEPGSLSLLAAGAIGLGLYRGKRRA